MPIGVNLILLFLIGTRSNRDLRVFAPNGWNMLTESWAGKTLRNVALLKNCSWENLIVVVFKVHVSSEELWIKLMMKVKCFRSSIIIIWIHMSGILDCRFRFILQVQYCVKIRASGIISVFPNLVPVLAVRGIVGRMLY